MKIEVDITRSDYADFNQYFYYKKGIWKRLRIVLFASLIIPLIIVIGKPFELVFYLINVIFAGLIFGIIYLGLGYLNIKRSGKVPDDNGSILGKRSFTITDDGLVEESENNVNLQKWTGIRSIESNKNSIFLFVDKIAAYIIPKRYFENDVQLNDFLNFINAKINNTQQRV